MMPVMDGPAFIAALKLINPQAKVIAASGLSSSKFAVRAKELGAKHFLTKPYDVRSLLEMVNALIHDPA